MILKRKTIADVKHIFDFLLHIVELEIRGDKQEIDNGTFEYAKMVLIAAEQELRLIEMYETTLVAINVVEKLILKNDLTKAYKILHGVSCDLILKSETKMELRNLFVRLQLPK